MKETLESTPQHERLLPGEVCLATSTFYPGWYPGELEDIRDVDKIRGDLALESIGKAQQQGMSIALVDGGSSPSFIDELSRAQVEAHDQQEPGLSGSRRKAFRLAASLGPKIVFTIEPEKVSLFESTSELLAPIQRGETDIVIPKRDEQAFSTYPPVQAEFEIRANKKANEIVRSHGLLPEDQPDIDFWVGVRLFRNDPQLLKLFTDKYEMKPREAKIGKILNMELWQNAQYIPIVMALAKGLRIKSVDIPYYHPQIQTISELGDNSFDRKREVQYRSIILGIIHAVRKIEQEKGTSDKQSRLIPS